LRAAAPLSFGVRGLLETLMDAALRRLMEVLLPPDGVAGRNENWHQVEGEIGLTFPSHFKELLGVYGDAVWFDLYHILYPTTTEPTELYLEAVGSQLNILVEYGMTDVAGNEIKMPLYPEPSGLFPFMASSDGDYYYWRTDARDPDKWPMVRWEMDILRPLPEKTLAELFLKTLEDFRVRQPHRVWVRPRIGS
jgi:hypothetical protein